MSVAARHSGSRLSKSERLGALLIALALAAPLFVGSMLHPDPRGHGTHEQLGWPACGAYMATGRPCPTCGMTTAFSNASHGHFVEAWLNQPFGLLLALMAAGGFWIALHSAAYGSRAGAVASKLILRASTLWVLAGLWLASWGYTLCTWPPPR